MHVDFEHGEFSGGAAPLLEWVRRSADIVSRYYGRFPRRERHGRSSQPQSGAGVHGGKTFANPNAFIRVQRRAARSPPAQLLERLGAGARDDASGAARHGRRACVALGGARDLRRRAWRACRPATAARPTCGRRSCARCPAGCRRRGDRGLDHTHTWGRTYWGGAMFCLLADVDIRGSTHLRFGLQDALRAVLRASGGLCVGLANRARVAHRDAAVGTSSLEELYAQPEGLPGRTRSHDAVAAPGRPAGRRQRAPRRRCAARRRAARDHACALSPSAEIASQRGAGARPAGARGGTAPKPDRAIASGVPSASRRWSGAARRDERRRGAISERRREQPEPRRLPERLERPAAPRPAADVRAPARCHAASPTHRGRPATPRRRCRRHARCGRCGERSPRARWAGR